QAAITHIQRCVDCVGKKLDLACCHQWPEQCEHRMKRGGLDLVHFSFLPAPNEKRPSRGAKATGWRREVLADGVVEPRVRFNWASWSTPAPSRQALVRTISW